jgi:pyrroline-5-carboxylate reductase
MATYDRIVLIGAGVMGEALLAGITGHVGNRADVGIVEPNVERASAIAREYQIATLTLAEALGEPATFILAVKPQQIPDLLGQLTGMPAGSIIVSVVAGVTAQTFVDALPGVEVIRAMPNTPARIGQGVTGVAGEHASADALRWAIELLGSVGHVVVLPEPSIDALTAVSGSGPAYVFLLAEAMIDGGMALGLSEQDARALVTGTVQGAGMLLAQTGLDPAELRRQVTSPGGTTQAAIDVLQDREFTDAVMAAMAAARDRSIELS